MTSWGVEGGEVPRWLFALQSWEFPPTTLFLSLPLASLVQGGDRRKRWKARRPAPSLGSSTSKHTHPPLTQHGSHCPPIPPIVLSWGLERGRGCLGLGQPAVHFDPSSLPAWLLTDCHSTAPCRHSQGCRGRSWALHHPPPHCLLASCPPQCQVGEGAKQPAPSRWQSEGIFVFDSVAICVNTSLFWKK